MMGLTSKERRIKTMKVELKQIIDELTDAINLPKGQKVSAIIDTDKIVGWTIVEVHEDGSIKPISDKKFNNLKGLISEYK
jgi:hypothetical protein